MPRSCLVAEKWHTQELGYFYNVSAVPLTGHWIARTVRDFETSLVTFGLNSRGTLPRDSFRPVLLAGKKKAILMIYEAARRG